MTVEVKQVYYRKKKKKKKKTIIKPNHIIDHIPNCFQLPRTPSVSKPRTVFYLPICSFKDFGRGIKSRPVCFSAALCVWVDPAVDLSPFEELFEDRRCNQAKEFQNALEQALLYKEQDTPCKDLFGSSEGADVLTHHDQSHERDNSSGSSRARSKRERKPKVHFDEVSRPLHTSRKVCRFKIMRSLGLAAPVGSPFNSLSSF